MKFKLGKTYRDKGSKNHPEDQFLRWINIEGSGMLNSPGVRGLGFTEKKAESHLPAYLILVTHEKSSGTHNPWEDIVDLSAAEILYWGDAKNHSSKVLDDFDGNKKLRQIYDTILDGNLDAIPPVLHFSKPSKGYVLFNGLCVLEKLDITWFDDGGIPVRNYHAKLSILDCDEVSVSWLHHRARTVAIDDLDKHLECPSVWLDYKKGRKKMLDIWIKAIRSEQQQLPDVNSKENQILEELINLDPYTFERVIVSLFSELTDITHHISGTKPSADGGFDFFGTFKLPRPLAYEIKFRGEVKRYARNKSIDPKSVSRLVARLTRQEYGIFVTTSYFTKQAQNEVLSDGYPVHLISGSDLVSMFQHLRLVSNGKIRKEWLDAVINNHQSVSVAKRVQS